MQGDGAYTYIKSGDVYFGAWYAGLKHGSGRYQFGSNDGCMEGEWEMGQIVKGTWNLAQAAVYTGEFKNGCPYGAGKFDFAVSGLTQSGSYVESTSADNGEDEDETTVGDQPKVPKVEWRGQSLVAF
jgi:MORN repeat